MKYIRGLDSPYINFSLPIIEFQQGEKYPGVLNDFPYSDSIPIGRFDSLKYIIFRGTEPIWSDYAKNIGEIESDIFFPKYLIKARVGGKFFP